MILPEQNIVLVSEDNRTFPKGDDSFLIFPITHESAKYLIELLLLQILSELLIVIITFCLSGLVSQVLGVFQR